ncbi:MAG: YhgE/Pip family protein, partial [Mycoplasmataceae bacterium]|nr:YhgE/Pip family protein [Mycoplasmataceae bacterium]
EMKNSLFSSKFRIKRFIAFLLVPFLYAFTFTYAFFNPFAKAENIPFQVVTQDRTKNGNFLNALADSLTKPGEVEVGEMKIKIKMKHVQLDPTIAPEHIYSAVRNLAKDGFTTYYLPAFKSTNTDKGVDGIVETMIQNMMKDKLSHSHNFNVMVEIMSLINALKVKVPNGDGSKQVAIFNNYRKNYLLGFSSELSGDMTGKYRFLAYKVLEAIEIYADRLHDSGISPVTQLTLTEKDYKNIKAYINEIRNSGLFDLRPVHIVSKMGGDFAMYGFGLAPLFISIGIWISAIVGSMIFHKKIIDKNLTAGRRFFVKYFAASIFVFVQAIILMLPLYFIGFNELSFLNWMYTTFAVAFIGIIFLGIVLSIRFLIPNKPVGIFLTIILLVIQIVTSDGLFPTETQGQIYTFLNNVFPMGYSIKILRETMYDTNVNKLFISIGIMASFWLIPLFAVLGYAAHTKRFYKKQGWVYPTHISKRGDDV